MDWSYVGKGTVASNSGTDPTVTPGAAPGVGGVLYLSVWANSATPTDPSGWTLVGAQSRTRLLVRLADGSAADTPTVSLTGTSSLVAQIARFTGGPLTLTGIVDAYAGNGATTGEDIETAGITTPAGNGRLILYVGALAANDSHLPWDTLPNGSTEIESGYYYSGSGLTYTWSYAIQTTAAAVGASAFTQDTSATTGTAREVTASLVPRSGTGWEIVAVGAASSADRGSAGTLNLTPGAPSGSGGVLLLLVSSRGQPTSFTTPSGWTAIANTASQRNAVYARVSDGGADDTPTMAVVLGASGCATATITRWSGGNTTLGSLLNGTVSGLYGAAPGGINVPSKTPSVDNCLVLRGGQCQDDANGPFYAAPSGDTFLCEDTHTSGYGEDIWACWVYQIQTTAAAVSSGQIDNNKTSSDSYAIGLALTAGAADASSPLILPHRSSGGMIDLSGNFRG